MSTFGDLMKPPVITDYKWTFGFGKWEHHTIEIVLQEDPQYILWASENVKGLYFSKEILNDARLASESFTPDEDDYSFYP